MLPYRGGASIAPAFSRAWGGLTEVNRAPTAAEWSGGRARAELTPAEGREYSGKRDSFCPVSDESEGQAWGFS